MSDTLNPLADVIARQFISRSDVKAVQHHNGIYTPDRTPFTRDDLLAHLRGTKTFGHYMVGLDDTTKLFAFDIDLAKGPDLARPETIHPAARRDENGDLILTSPRGEWKRADSPYLGELTTILRCVGGALAIRTRDLLGHRVAISYSGSKGLHVYAFFAEPMNAGEAREQAWFVLESFGSFERFRGQNFWRHSTACPEIEIETFPKQAGMEGKELGNLMRLPLGIHRVNEERGFMVDPSLPDDQLEPLSDPLTALVEGNV